MTYRVVITKRVERQMRALPASVEFRMRSAIKGLATNPRPSGSLKLNEDLGYRIRVGSYRIIYDNDDRGRIIIINAALHRKDAYK